jgi:serine/threonine protein kinase
VAVKKIPFNSLNDDLVQEMLNEARIMESIRHPNVLSLMGCCPRPPEVCIVMEYMPRGSLYQILQDSRIPLSWQLIQRMALDAARGMNFLHQHNPIIMHRDLKSHNLLVDDAWRVKVADFGLSRMIEERVSATMTVCGTPCWTAPEVLRNQRYSVKADVYSFGICLWELYSRTAPYSGMTPFQVMFGVASSGMRPPINEDDCPEPWRELMLTCWSESPEDRPTFDQIARTLQSMVLPETGGFH